MSNGSENLERPEVVAKEHVFYVGNRRITVPSQRYCSYGASKKPMLEFILHESRDTETGQPVDETIKNKLKVSIGEVYPVGNYRIIDKP